MKLHLWLGVCLTLVAPFAQLQAAAPAPGRLARADSFLGIHFDFHAGPDCTEIGKNTTREMIENIINLVHPDYLQIDCKGHRGLCSYPTKVGNPAPGFVGGDPLKLWREVTAERGVSLYMHYSGVWDSEAILRNPGWGAINADGKTNGNATSFFSPYADQLLIPQLRELAGDYGVDGVWVDGECWASVPDYGPAALAAFKEATGIDTVPRKPGDPHWFEFLQFHRDLFRKYLRHYVTEVRKTHPKFQLCSNWAYTDHMPEPALIPVDFLSGDYSPEDSVNSARLSARYLARQGKPWDLMAWSFSLKPGAGGRTQKTAVQMQREAAVVLALGGGFQAYHRQKRDGSIYPEQMPAMAEVAKFCRARQLLCHRAEQVPQIALLYSTAAHYRNVNGLFSRDPSMFRGTLEALLEAQQSVELLGEHHLAGRMADYPLIVVPEWPYLDPAFREQLIAYVREGGNLLLVGPRAAALFASELDAKPQGSPTQTKRLLAHDGQRVATRGYVQAVELGGKATPVGRLYETAEGGAGSQLAASVASLGKGRIAATWFDFSQGYLDGRNATARAFLAALVKELFPQPLVEVTGSPHVDVVVNRIQNRLAINLVNTSGPHATEPIIDQIDPVGPLTLVVRQAEKPSRVTLEPGARPLPFEHAAGEIRLTVPKVDIHDIVMIR